MTTRYLGQRYWGPRYFGPRYVGGSTPFGVLAVYDGVVTLRPGSTNVLNIGSTNVIELSALKDEISGNYPTDATVTAQVLTPNGVAVTGAASLTMAHVSGTTGAATIYRGVLPASVAATLALQAYAVIVTAIDTSGNTRVFTVATKAKPG